MANGNHLFWVVRHTGPPRLLYAVNVKDSGSTDEFKLKGFMFTHRHRNSVLVVCAVCFPFQLGTPHAPKIKYTRPGETYTHSAFSFSGCIAAPSDMCREWTSSAPLIWVGWPLQAIAQRTIPLRYPDNLKYAFLPGGASKTSHTPTYTVD